MKTPSRRPEQVGETIRQVVADALAREVRDPRVGFVTVTAVRVTNELSHARVMVSVRGDEAAKTSAMEGLESAAGFLRSRVARALTTRTVPELHFELDRGHEHAARIHELLSELKRDAPEQRDASEGGGAGEGPEASKRPEASD
jgi:ribosome-binding factor A